MPTAQSTDEAAGKRLNLWTVPDFVIVWWSQFSSRVGNQISVFVLPLLILETTGSPAMSGLLSGLEQIPYLLLAIPAGALMERADKRTVMIVGNALRAFFLGALAVYLLLGGRSIWLVAGIVLANGVVYVFFDMASSTVFPRILPQGELARASSWVEGTTALTEVLGPALAGMLMGLGATILAGAGYAFGADAVSFLIAAVSVVFVRTSLKTVTSGPKQSMSTAAREGIRYLLGHAELRRLAVANFANIAVLSTGWLTFMVSMRSFGLDVSHTGLLVSVGAVAGILGSLSTGYLGRRLSTHQIMLFSGTGWVIGELMIAAAPAPWAALAGLAVVLGAAPPYFSTLYAHRMSLIPEELRTRVNSMYRLLAQAGPAIGLPVGGSLLQAIGWRSYAVLGAGIFLAVAVWVHFRHLSALRYAQHHE